MCIRDRFEEVVRQCIEKGLVSGRLAATDSTHGKANASRASEHLVEMLEEPGAYWERLDSYEEEGLQALEKRTGHRRKMCIRDRLRRGLHRDAEHEGLQQSADPRVRSGSVHRAADRNK